MNWRTTTAQEMSRRGSCPVVACLDEQPSSFLKTWAESESASYRLTQSQIRQTVAKARSRVPHISAICCMQVFVGT